MSRFSLLALVVTSGCGGCLAQGEVDTEATTIGPDPTLFAGAALVGEVSEEACTLSSGTSTLCYRITIAGQPTNHAVGPFCPANISDSADNAGIWIEDGKTWDLTGAFIADLASFYEDDNWMLYDAQTGDINITDTQAACEAAARPNVDPQYQNHCVECSLDYLDGPQPLTVLLPKEPVKRTASAGIGGQDKVGISLNGVVFDPPAPVDAILGAYTIAAFDDCGGHVNPHTGYHYHAATGCSEESAQSDGHAPLLGYALDGFGLYAMLDGDGEESSDLDVCRGHEDAVRGYHYHVASAGENMFIGCFMGEAGSVQ